MMGSIDKYCPHCGSEEVWKFEMDLSTSLYDLEEPEVLWYECADCHSEWEPHRHVAKQNT